MAVAEIVLAIVCLCVGFPGFGLFTTAFVFMIVDGALRLRNSSF